MSGEIPRNLATFDRRRVDVPLQCEDSVQQRSRDISMFGNRYRGRRGNVNAPIGERDAASDKSGQFDVGPGIKDRADYAGRG